jgi:fibronectin type 3 domain-containing protein
VKRSLLRAGLLAALCALPAASALASFYDVDQWPWQGGENHFCGNTWISNSMTFTNSGSLIYNTSTLPASTGPLNGGRSGDYWYGIGVLVDGSDGATINNNSGGTIQGIVTGSGQGEAAGIYSVQNVTVNNSGIIDAQFQNNDGDAYGVYVDSGQASITNNAGATISATAPYYVEGVQAGQLATVVNNGTITATATGGTQGDTANNCNVDGVGLFAYCTDGSCALYVENNGTITASSTAGSSVTNRGDAVVLWGEGAPTTFRNTGLVTPSMAGGSQGEIDGIYEGSDNADVSFYNSGTFSQTVNGVAVWLEQDSDVGDMRIDNSGIIRSTQTWSIELGAYSDGNTSGHCYVTNTGSITGGWLGLAWPTAGGFTFYDSGDIHVGLNWLGGNADVHVFGLPTIDPAINNYGSGGSNLVFNLIGTLQKVNGNAASGTNLSAFSLGSSGNIVVSGKTYGWNNFSTVSGTVRPMGSVPPPWQQQDIGSVRVAGGAVCEGGMFALLASGTDIWNTADAFHYVYQSVSNNCTLIARVSAEQTTSANAKGGVMIRDSLNANAANAFIEVMPSNRVVFQYRSSDGGGSSSNSVTGLSASYWVKLAQSGSTLTGYYSVDGVKWTQLGSTTISMGATNYAGLAYCNNNNSSSGTVTFYSVNCAGSLFVPSAPAGVTATAGVEQVMLNWQAASNAASYNIGRSTVSGGPDTTVGSTSGTNYTDADLAGRTTYYYVVTTENVGGQGASSAQVSATPTANMPPPWVAQDIGPVRVNGSESYSSNVVTVTASGNDIASGIDAFRFVYETNSGNCSIVARVASQQKIDGWSKAGVMIRRSLNANAANVFIGMTPSNGVVWQYRSKDGSLGGVANNVTNPVVPCWVRLAQSGSAFTGYYSADGVNWTQLGTTTISMGASEYVGFAVCSHSALSLCTATFDNVSAPGWPPLAGPTGLTATAAPGGQVNLTWNALTNATSYNVKRSIVSGGPYTTIASGVTTTNYTDTASFVSAECYYVVSAIVGGSETANSAEVVLRHSKLTGTIIGTPGSWGNSGNTITNVFDNNLNTFFDAPDPGNGDWVGLYFGASVSNAIALINYCPRSGYESRMVGGIFQGANQADFSDAVTLYTVTAQPPSGVFTSVSLTNTSAFRYVRYLSPNGGYGNVAELEFYGYLAGASVPLPAAPGGLAATAVSSSQINLAWNTVTNAASYNVKRSTTNGGPYAVVATGVTATNYNDTGLTDAITYYYVVSAVNTRGESTNSAQVSATTPVAPPAAPARLTATAVSTSQINLNWTASSGAASYNVRRSTTNGGPYMLVATGVTATSYPDSGMAGGKVYYYVVSAVNSGGESTNSAQASAATLSPTLGSLVHRYSFSETGGATVADSVGGPVWAGTLPSGGTLSGGQLALASASQQYASLPSGIVGSLSNVTVMAWVNLASVSYWSRVFDFGNDTTTYMYLTPRNGFDYTMRFAISTSGAAGEQKINCPVAVNPGAWHQVAVSLNAGTGVLYLDGVAVGTNAGLTLNPSSLGSTTRNYLGKSQSGSDPYLNGSLDEFRIYNVALSPAEIATTAALGPDQLLSTNAPLLGLALTGTNVTVSWPLANAGFTLQSRTYLALGDWVNVTSPAPQIVGGQWQVALPSSGNGQSVFYRLSK